MLNSFLKASNEIKSSTYFERGDIIVAKITPSSKTESKPLRLIFQRLSDMRLQKSSRCDRARRSKTLVSYSSICFTLTSEITLPSAWKARPADSVCHRTYSLDIHYPEFPLEEQTAIADRLEMVQRRIAVEEKSARTASALKRAAIRTLFAHGLRGEPPRDTEMGPMPESWERLRIAELGTIVTGNTPPTGEQANYANGSVPFVAPGDIKHGSIIEKTEKLITARGLRRSRPIPAGTTCFVCIGSSIGKVGYCTFEISASNQQINSIISNPQHDSLFIFYLMIFWSDYVRTKHP